MHQVQAENVKFEVFKIIFTLLWPPLVEAAHGTWF